MAGRPAGSGSVLACRQLSSGRLRSELGRGGLAPLTATAKRSGGSVPAAAADAKYVQFDKGLRQGGVASSSRVVLPGPLEEEGSAYQLSNVLLDMG